MTKTTKIPEPDGIRYHVEELPGDRGQLVADVVAGGRRADSYRFGSAAPLDRVRAAAVKLNRFPNPSPEATDRRSPPTTPHQLTAAEATAR
jgi:hypothetical protein